MITMTVSGRLARATALAACAGLFAAPVGANVNIPEGGAVERGSFSVVHLRVLDGCDGEATDSIAMGIPRSVEAVTPEAVPGWTVEVETAGDDDMAETKEPVDVTGDERITLVRWTGGPLPAGQFMDFGFRAQFPDEDGATVAFPVTQTCGLTEIRWDGDKDADNAAPLVAVGDHVGQRELGDLADTVAGLAQQLEGVDPAALQGRLGEVEGRVDERLPEMVDRMDRLANRIKALEEAGAEAPADPDAPADE